MANTADTYEPTWRKCDECDRAYFIGATLNPRNHKWRPIPLSLRPADDVPGNFEIDWRQEFVEIFDALNQSLGHHPVVVYGQGNYRPHNPSHFLPEHHGETVLRPRPHNFRLQMDDDE